MGHTSSRQPRDNEHNIPRAIPQLIFRQIGYCRLVTMSHCESLLASVGRTQSAARGFASIKVKETNLFPRYRLYMYIRDGACVSVLWLVIDTHERRITAEYCYET